jgi:anti-sigma B factor antagonist
MNVVARGDHRGWVVVALGGELDLATAPRIRSELIATISGSPARAVAIDLRGARFIDSVGLGVLIGARRRALASGGRLAVVVNEGFTERTIGLAGLTELLDVHPSLDDLPMLG